VLIKKKDTKSQKEAANSIWGGPVGNEGISLAGENNQTKKTSKRAGTKTQHTVDQQQEIG